jgi:hypothetical protein
MYASDTKQTKAKTNSGGAVEFNELVSFRKEKDMDTIKASDKSCGVSVMNGVSLG